MDFTKFPKFWFFLLFKAVNPRVVTRVKVSRLSKEPKLNPIFTKALLKDRQNLDLVGVCLEASIGNVIPGKANVKKVNV